MCEACDGDGLLTRRGFLAASVGSLAALASVDANPLDAMAVQVVEPVTVAPGLSIRPRAAWAGRLKPRGPLKPEPDAKFLLVHHTAGASTYSRSAVPGIIRNVFLYQTGTAKGWPDTCYNFFIDRYGGVWEGRKGSLDGPVTADATGGSQGFAQLVCLMGNFETAEPTPAMIDALARLLGWLGARDGIDLNQRNKVSFVSRGSNKWRKGAKVSARPISGHRDMSYTACPGRNVYPLLARTVPAKARAYQATIQLPA